MRGLCSGKCCPASCCQAALTVCGQEVVTRDLLCMGVQVVSFTLKDVSDEVDYLSSLGRCGCNMTNMTIHDYSPLLSGQTSRWPPGTPPWAWLRRPGDRPS